MKNFFYIGIAVFLIAIIVVVVFSKNSKNVQNTNKTDTDSNFNKYESNLKFPIKYLKVNGKDVMSNISKIRTENSSQTPVILGDQDGLRMISEVAENNESTPESLITQGLKINVDDFLKKRVEKDSEIYNDATLVGSWTDDVKPIDHLTAHTDIQTGKPLNEVYIGLLPTTKSYEIPAYLKYGGWNACPVAEEHVALMKYWHDKYGSNIISITGDTIECVVDNPPKTKEEAIKLAREQFIYCEDIVSQGYGSISALAGTLINAKYWYFWWD